MYFSVPLASFLDGVGGVLSALVFGGEDSPSDDMVNTPFAVTFDERTLRFFFHSNIDDDLKHLLS